MSNEPLSNCCHAPMKVKGDTTLYYVCAKCNMPCDQSVRVQISELKPIQNTEGEEWKIKQQKEEMIVDELETN